MEKWFEKKGTIIACIAIVVIIAFSVWDCSQDDNESYGDTSIEVSNYLESCRSKCTNYADTLNLEDFFIKFNDAKTEEELRDLLKDAKEYFK